MNSRKRSCLAAVALLLLSGCSPDQTASNAGSDAPVVVRRLTRDQYQQIVSDVFGPSTQVGGRFEPDMRDVGGLIAAAASHASISASGVEQYDRMARSIAAQVLDEKHRPLVMPCQPASANAPDDSCAAKFLSTVGRYLYRRPLTGKELQIQVAGAAAATRRVGSFYAGLQLSLASQLVAPQFLFVQEFAEPDPERPGASRLDAWSKATRLSFFLWNTAPDATLLAAAETGELQTKEGLTEQVDRMLSSPRLEAGVRAFFADMLELDLFENLGKDPTLYPKYTPKVGEQGREQTLRTIVDLLVTQKGDYRDLFTTRKTFLTGNLASVYNVPLALPNRSRETWIPYEFDADADQAGILTHVSFVGLHSHPGRSSATLRGKALREVLLCQKVPDPPGNVDFRFVQDTENPEFKTARARITAHSTDATCAGCHKITDPIGLALEKFDTIGGFRQLENGAEIDTGGDLDGITFTDAAGLGEAVHDHPALTSCLVKKLYTFAVGRPVTRQESTWLESKLEKRFASEGYRVPILMRTIALSDEFFRVAPLPAVADAGR